SNYYEAIFILSDDNNIITRVRDITESKNLTLYNERYKDLIRKAPFAFAYHRIILDEFDKPIDYEFLEINEAFELMTNLKKSEVVNQKVTDVIPSIKNDNFDWINFYGETALNGNEKVFEQYSESLNRWYKVKVYSTEKYYFSTLFEDITYQKEEEEKSILIERKYKSLIENAPDAVTVIGEDLKYKYASPAIKKLGYTIEELLSIDPNEITNPEDLPLLRNTIQAVLENPSKPITVEYRFKDANNNWIWIESTFSNMLNEPNINGIVINSRGINDRKIVEEALRKNEAKYRFLIENISDVIWIFDVESKKMIFMSPSIAKLTGYSVNEAKNQTLED
ncbi:MAG: PAS domain S-box protein, partial [Candidatus Sericytochromatia bacterium]